MDDEEDWNGRLDQEVCVALETSAAPQTSNPERSTIHQLPPRDVQSNLPFLKRFLSQEQCVVCLRPLRHAVLIDQCLHGFCFECLAKWTIHLRRTSKASTGNKCPLCKTSFERVLANFDDQNHFDRLRFDDQTIRQEQLRIKRRQRLMENRRKQIKSTESNEDALDREEKSDESSAVPDRQESLQRDGEESDPYRFNARVALYHRQQHEKEDNKELKILSPTEGNCVCLDQPIVKVKGEYEAWVTRELQACIGARVDSTLFLALIYDALAQDKRSTTSTVPPRQVYEKMQRNLLALLDPTQATVLVHEVARFLSTRLNIDAYDALLHSLTDHHCTVRSLNG